ncbi:alpha-mannosidase [Pleurocapsales cyanobacterium LEGE 06147]|nr:alpha-mannosidase [Pleurocapsales cyanobacterium LEGE 06147]
MTNQLPMTIESAIEKLHQLTRINVQDNWYWCFNDLPINQDSLITINPNNWQLAPVNQKGCITWSKGHKVCWVAQKITIPRALKDYPLSGLALRLILTWWAEDAQIFINGKLVQQGDLFDSSARIVLTKSAIANEKILVAIRLVSPGHDIGALMRSQCVYEREQHHAPAIPNSANSIDPGFIADELSILYKYLAQFESEKLTRLAQEINRIDWDLVANAEEFDRSLANLRQRLLPLAKEIEQRCFYPIGHAHLDMAWLWTTRETYEVAQRTFQSVLNLQQEFPYLTFCHTSPALYEWIEQNRPDLFAAIVEAVKQGKWEVIGGMWVEPEVNLVSGESLVRQLLYGQKYIKEQFGEITRVAWLPDSFGFCWQLPQIFKQSGIDYFVTGKLHWNDTTKFPHGCFWWESPDGTQIFTLMSPPNITGVMDTNPITMTDYAVDWENQTGLQEIFWLPGVGDHGGGPTRDMLEVAKKWHNSPFFPKIEFSTAIEYLNKISQNPKIKSNSSFPIWKDELYLEFHRGCYTTHADQKRFNRCCEGLLYQAELFATLASLIQKENGDRDWLPKIEEAWKKVLFNQFHDILPGTSIPEVFTEANRAWEEVIEVGEEILTNSLKAIASCLTLPPPPQPEAKPIFVFNPLNWERSEVVAISVSQGTWEVWDLDGKKVRAQLSKDKKLLFLAENIPSVGYRLFWFCRNLDNEPLSYQDTKDFVLENEYLKVVVNSQIGDLDGIFDKINQKEVLKGAGNQLQAFEDRGQYWDAWNIDPNYHQHPLSLTTLKSIQWLENGEIQQCIRVVRQLGNSEFRQDYILQAHSPILKIATTVDWQETHVLVKVAFPLNVESDWVTYEIPGGAIARSTRPQTPADKAKWEVPALRWADLSDNNEDYGVSLLNNCKYGYDSQPNCLRLTLLRSPIWPDPTADKGIHQFTYAIYPHRGSWRSAKTVHRGYELNLPLQVVIGGEINKINNQQYRQLPPVSSLLNLSAENLILMAFKYGEDEDLILRCYECQGETAKLVLQGNLELKIAHLVDLLERKEQQAEDLKEKNIQQIKSWQIATFKLNRFS